MNGLTHKPGEEGSSDGSTGTGLLLSALVVGFASWLGAEFGLAITFPETGSAILFPPYAALAAALLLTRPRVWWVYLAASFAGHMLVDVIRGGPTPLAFLASTEIANAVRALVAAVLWRLLRPNPPKFDTLENAAIFLVVAGLLAPAAGALVGAGVVVQFGRAGLGIDSYLSVWAAWFLSNAIVGVTLLPLILIAASRAGWRRDFTFDRVAELSILIVGSVAVAIIAFVGVHDTSTLLIRLAAPIPFLLWAATRFGAGATGATVLIVTVCAIFGATNGGGPFAPSPSDNGVLSLYLFIGLTSVPCLLLATLVHERKHVLTALREGERRYRLATSAGSVGVWDWRFDSGEIYVDPVVKGALGYADSEIQNNLADWLRHMHPADVERVLTEAGAYHEGRSSIFEVEYRMIHREGTVRWFSSRGAAAGRRDETPMRLVGTTFDITGRKLAEIELQERRRDLTHLGRVAVAGQLSGAFAHELRQPLAAILANTQSAQHLLSHSEPDLDELAGILHEIEHDDIRANDVIVRLKALLKKGEVTLELLRLQDVVQDGLRIANADLVTRGVAVERVFEDSLPPIYGDRVELQQVVVNLVVNACDAMDSLPPAERRLTVGTMLDAHGFVVAYAADSGRGILQQDLERIFDPFVTSKSESLGLGLSICRTIATAHGGRLWAKNGRTGGATFLLALPPARDP